MVECDLVDVWTETMVMWAARLVYSLKLISGKLNDWSNFLNVFFTLHDTESMVVMQTWSQ